MDLKQNFEQLLNSIPDEVKLVAVSKTKPVELIRQAYDAGHKVFGENKVQELTHKHPELPTDIEWHFIGHLQRNKVKFIAPFVHMIHSIDSFRLLREVNKEARKADRTVNCLLQFHIADEDTKFGLDMDEADEMIMSEEYKMLENINICGVMGMATFTADENMIRNEFKNLKKIFDQLKAGHFSDSESFKEISMGMSGDYNIAIEEGSTIIRVGSAIFGSRY